MHRIIATLGVVSLFTVVFVAAAGAAPTTVNVRIEGRAETLFEGPITAEPDAVQASSDPEPRRCDGINPLDPQNVTPTPVPTSVAADALSLIGESFDGQWYPGFDDYFITRWGPDPQSEAEGAYWGILVNNVYTNVGGCQYQLSGGDEVFWAYDAFHDRPILALFPEAANYTSGTRPLTTTVPLGTPLAVEVDSYADDEEGTPPETPGAAGTQPFAGAEVAPVVTTAQGFERVNVKSPATKITGADGKASVEFAKPGWHRVKATVVSPAGKETALRSNRLDVCVVGGTPSELEKPLEGASTCAELPAADKVRATEPLIGTLPEKPAGSPVVSGGAAGTSGSSATAPPKPAAPPPFRGTLRVSLPRVDRKGLAIGRVGVSWKVEDPGAGVARWTISSLTLGAKHARYVTRASGRSQTAATVKLPPGHRYKLRFGITDSAGATSTVALGQVKVPKPPRRKG